MAIRPYLPSLPAGGLVRKKTAAILIWLLIWPNTKSGLIYL
ncbi:MULTISPECIES: hypothetical protein [Planktothricoides]|nr:MULTISPECIES: hypothetical protein [Planktothricoides]